MNNAWWVPVIAGISFFLTQLLRHYALVQRLVDVPNARSSHAVPTPRGGGLAIVLSFLLAVALLFATGVISLGVFAAYVGTGGLIAVIGFMDDHGHIAARWRLLGHFAAASWGLFWLGGLPVVTVLGFDFDVGWVGDILAVFYLVWMLNLYNFMDGIDGIASVEAICVCLGMCLLYWIGDMPELIWLPLFLAASVIGFLWWNFPPARIFMGDAGSGFLGGVLGLLSLHAAWTKPQMLWAWVILLGVFIVDATFTLLRRLFRGDKVYEAHRSHAYQFASRKMGSHRAVTLAVGMINICWLLPVALLVSKFELDGLVGVVVAYAPLVFLALKYRAGELETNQR
ncbi:glycosyltransferase family 4 protein [Pseudomonas sp. B21-051]|uniref:MraY family glycosyltransferase n=1 Tax=Pseudomonas sp. B21-051 TaxID=2895491 RepID=UPI00215E6B20|nr:glycosyltransferase family 4 protein [Pseudomonas sp. B21-051]UVK86896.1 glycosyltransferase family 4 protein [Pseudomonas sp. B21-051]